MSSYVPEYGHLESISREFLLSVIKNFFKLNQIIYLKAPNEWNKLENVAKAMEQFKEKAEHKNYYVETDLNFATKLMNFKSRKRNT